jgi:hypothetical protein
MPKRSRLRLLAGVGRVKLIIILATLTAVVLIVIAVVVSFSRGDPYTAFQKRCLAGQGNELVTLSTSVREFTMGGPEHGYKVACEQPNGVIKSTIETNHL